jgi:hypothetical protein
LIGFVAGLAIGHVFLVLWHGSWHYRAKGRQMERAWCVRLPGMNGHDVYIDFEEGVVTREWDEFGEYRVSPWMKCR